MYLCMYIAGYIYIPLISPVSVSLDAGSTSPGFALPKQFQLMSKQLNLRCTSGHHCMLLTVVKHGKTQYQCIGLREKSPETSGFSYEI